ncbi:MAG TPA: trehalose-6-phosphate synthase, partial [Jatrophihabitans sp.]|nr:trehalose-6-phosphate synthase [Jatrophihabitans sp.]
MTSNGPGPAGQREARPAGEYDFIIVANRLPVDRVTEPDGTSHWRRSPGGLVTALEPVMQKTDGAWVGWSGTAGESNESFDSSGMRLVVIALSEDEVRDYYEGFSNATLWPLYHDVI